MPKRLVFLYYTDGAAPPDKIPAYSLDTESSNHYAQQFKTDGLFYVFRRLMEKGVLEEVLIVTESNRSPGYIKTDFPGMKSIVVPHITCLDNLLRPDDLIFTRGGFRGWHDWLREKQAAGHWMWLYAANTGRQRWPWWDIVFDDCHDWCGIGETDPRGRHHLDYRKPINPDYFYAPDEDAPYDYDIMIGASHITDKKGQWRVVQALHAFEDAYGFNPRCIMPGSLRRSTKTLKMLDRLKKSPLKIEMPGMLNRAELGATMRTTKMFIHAGSSGQNDRGPLEAMACGCRIIINAPEYHHPLLTATASPNIALDCSRIHLLCDTIRAIVATPDDCQHKDRAQALEYFTRTHGVERVVIPDFERLMTFFTAYPTRNEEAKEVMSYALR